MFKKFRKINFFLPNILLSFFILLFKKNIANSLKYAVGLLVSLLLSFQKSLIKIFGKITIKTILLKNRLFSTQKDKT
ncbi:hypothetical protein HMPREF9444_01674 [Succinatimonas hippei YIT 12066]|uniref:Uncharacterized protein n=1 Tax=Succinatimonas hippei (strain DSM 22608 / JCM 16073 / KCTC 15190 / YIT 12066) TaxID=762983 RepID=E8LLN9_SUCHY|nr:hypothetical protein HMPREF9444_01674 [Succinatimonas hippei YIT 12066]